MTRIGGETEEWLTGRAAILICIWTLLLTASATFAQPKAANGSAGLHTGRGGIHREQSAQPVVPALPYHFGEKLICTDCHFVDAPDDALARRGYRVDPIDTCIRCHDGYRGIPDVIMDDINSLDDRSAGFFAAPGESNPRGHDLFAGIGGVTCIDCHDPHGNGNPRNLRWVSDPATTPQLGLFTAPAATGVRKYERANTAYGTLNNEAMREVTSICTKCHNKFSGQEHTGGVDHYTRHPSYDSERLGNNRISDGGGMGTSAPWHWEDGRGMGFDDNERVPFLAIGATDYTSATVVDASANAVFCLSCHKAHGSSSNDAIVWNTNVKANRTGCNQCHAIGPPDDNTGLALQSRF